MKRPTPQPWQTAPSMRVLEALRTGIEKGDYRRTSLAASLDLSSPATVQAHLKKLESGGLVVLAGRAQPTITARGHLFLGIWKKKGKL